MNTSENIVSILQDISKTGIVNPERIKGLSIEEQELIKNLHKDGLVDEALKFVNSINVDSNWKAFKKKILLKEKRTIPLWKKAFKYAAIFIVVFGSSFFLLNNFKSDDIEIKMSSDAIELILENGDKKILNANGESKIVKASGEVIGSQKGDVLNYKSNTSSQKLVYNELRVPYGKTFNIFLSDGTKVFLNAGTTLKYPVNFIKGKNREVFLEGEAYFEVSKDALHPFIVNANEMHVRVLGTKFNVSSYQDDSEINTVLVEGSVSLSNDAKPNESSLLEPGHKGSWNKSQSKISVEKVDTRIYTEWMNGDVIFRNATFEDMAKKLERNYNVTIENNYKDLSHKKFNASFNKKIESIDDIMVSIGEVYPFTYTKLDNKIIINP
jgi:transmembrane sensor